MGLWLVAALAAAHDPLTSTGSFAGSPPAPAAGNTSARPEWGARPVSKLISGRESGVRTCLLLLLQADRQSGGAAPTLSTVGFPDSTGRESHDRVHAAIRNAGLAIPVALITWRAHLRKVRISPRAVRG